MDKPFHDRWPYPFPLSNSKKNTYNILAPFWSHNDICISGQVCYEVHQEDSIYLSNISEFISLKTGDDFRGRWMLLVEWDSMHPYPWGAYWWSLYRTSVKQFSELVSF